MLTKRLRHQIFHTTPLTFALVNLKPLLPGHVLVVPRRVAATRFKDLRGDEVADLFRTVQRVGGVVERVSELLWRWDSPAGKGIREGGLC